MGAIENTLLTTAFSLLYGVAHFGGEMLFGIPICHFEV